METILDHPFQGIPDKQVDIDYTSRCSICNQKEQEHLTWQQLYVAHEQLRIANIAVNRHLNDSKVFMDEYRELTAMYRMLLGRADEERVINQERILELETLHVNLINSQRPDAEKNFPHVQWDAKLQVFSVSFAGQRAQGGSVEDTIHNLENLFNLLQEEVSNEKYAHLSRITLHHMDFYHYPIMILILCIREKLPLSQACTMLSKYFKEGISTELPAITPDDRDWYLKNR